MQNFFLLDHQFYTLSNIIYEHTQWVPEKQKKHALQNPFEVEVETRPVRLFSRHPDVWSCRTVAAAHSVVDASVHEWSGLRGQKC